MAQDSRDTKMVATADPAADPARELSEQELSQVAGGIGEDLAKLQVEPVDFKPKGSLLGLQVEPVDFTPKL